MKVCYCMFRVCGALARIVVCWGALLTWSHQALVSGASVANLVQNFAKRHPYTNRPLIDYTGKVL